MYSLSYINRSDYVLNSVIIKWERIKLDRSKENISNREIKLGALMSYLAIVIYMLAGLMFTPWMVQIIGQENYGLYTLATSLISIFLMDFGLSSAVTRFVSKYNAVNDQESIGKLLGIVYRLFFVIDLFITGVLFILYFNISIIYQELSVTEINSLKVVYIIIASFSIISFPFTTLNGILTSYEKFMFIKACDLFQRFIHVVITFIALRLGYGLYALVTIHALSGLLSIAAKIYGVRRFTPIKIKFFYKNSEMFNEILKFSLWTTVISIAQRFIFNITPSILGVISGSASIAIFGIASTLEGYVYMFSSAINGLFLPKVSRIVAEKGEERNDILSLMTRVGRIQISILALIFIGFVCLGKDFTLLWMGPKFSKAYLCAVVLMIPSLLELPQHIANLTIVATNKVKYQSIIFVLMALLNVLMSIPLTMLFDELGASISIGLAYLFRTIAMNIIYQVVLKIRVIIFFKDCYLKLMPWIILSFFVGKTITFLFPAVGWVELLIKAVMIAAAYIVLMWLFAWNSYEKGIFISFLDNITNRIKKQSYTNRRR